MENKAEGEMCEVCGEKGHVHNPHSILMKGQTNYYTDCKVKVSFYHSGDFSQVYVEIYGTVAKTDYAHPYINLSREDAKRLRDLLDDYLKIG